MVDCRLTMFGPGPAPLNAVQISCSRDCSSRLCRPALRKGSAFPWSFYIFVTTMPSPLGRGCRATAPSSAVAGRVRGWFVTTGNRMPHSAQKFFRVLHHQPIRNAQQPYPPGSEIIFLLGVLSHLAGLRVNPSVQFNGQSMPETVEGDDPVLQSKLAAELGTQLSVAQELPRRLLGLGLAAPQFAKTLGGDAHGASVAGFSLRSRGGSVGWRRDPSPVPLRLMKTPAAGHPLPKGEGWSSVGGKAGQVPGRGQSTDKKCRNSRERRSLSAKQTAEPQVVTARMSLIWTSLSAAGPYKIGCGSAALRYQR